jgi:uncharacterized RDD family membrane protein YckC
MKCQGCGHDYPSTLTRCTHCRLLNPKRAQNSRLIEFPRKARASVERETVQNPLPAWRQEVSEKVRAAKARRNSPTYNSTPDPAPLPEATQPVADLDYAEASRYENQFNPRTAPLTPPARTARSYTGASSVEPGAGSAAPARTASRTNDNIVEAALTRVRRATENASRASLPKIEPARPVQTAKSSIIVDREATARALEPRPLEPRPLEPTVDMTPKTRLVTTPLPRIAEEPAAPVEPAIKRPTIQSSAIPVPEPVEPQVSAEPRLSAELRLSAEPVTDMDPPEEITMRETIIVLDEMEPLDYLAAEINKVAAGDEFAHNESPSLFTHVVIGLTDLITIVLSCTPFLALIEIVNGNYAYGRTRVAVAVVLLVVSSFYLALTQGLCGKTFGMMLTNTRLVDAQNYEPISAGRAMLRTLGYFIAFAPAMIGLLWPALNRQRRAWQDYIAGTLVARDF